MQINSIATENFKALAGKREYTDIPAGIIGIGGDNGVGKSTLMSAVAFALYGPEVLDTGNADVVTWGAKKGIASVNFDLNNHNYGVTRIVDKGTAKAELLRDGEVIAKGPTVVTEEVTNLLGIERVGFLASVFSRQEDLLGIGSLQAARRASTVLRLLGIDQVDVAVKKIAEDSRDLNKQLDILRLTPKPTKSEYTPEFVAELREMLDGYQSELHHVESDEDALVANIKSLETKHEAYVAYTRVRDRLEGELTAAKEAMRKALAEAEEPLPPEPTAPRAELDPEVFDDFVKDHDRLVKAQSNSICPTCKRPYDSGDAQHIADEIQSVANWIKENRPLVNATIDYRNAMAKRQRLEEDKAAAQVRADNSTAVVDDRMTALEALEPVEGVVTKYNEAAEALRENDRRKGSIRESIVKVESDIKYAIKAETDYKAATDAYAAVASQITDLESRVLVNGHASRVMQGYKTDLIANVIPAITAKASTLITEMTEGKYTELSLTPQYEIEYRNEQGDLKAFPNLSGGEKDVFALALRLAIADIKAGSVGVLVLDEVLESLDSSRQEAVWESLERQANRYNQVFLITHVDAFKDKAPHSIAI